MPVAPHREWDSRCGGAISRGEFPEIGVDTLRTCAQDRLGDRTMTRGCRFHRILGLFLFLRMAFGADSVSGYRYLFDDVWSEPEPMPWLDETWAPGETLSFVLIEDAEWTEGFDDLAAVEAVIEDEAMDLWSGISTADIRWDVGSTAAARTSGTSEIYIDHETSGRGGAFIFAGSGTDGRRIRSCDIYLPPYLVPRSKESVRDFFIHELGHCLGLHHAGVFWPRQIRREVAVPAAWSADPMMSYGFLQGGVLTADDRIGASLLRPASGWKAGTGGIRGNVLVKDEGGAGFVHVVATKLDTNGEMVESVGSFTNAHGEFLIEGLTPGPYSLLARSITRPTAHPGRWSFAEGNVRDALQTAPVTVRAGQISGGVSITMRRGEYRW